MNKRQCLYNGEMLWNSQIQLSILCNPWKFWNLKQCNGQDGQKVLNSSKQLPVFRKKRLLYKNCSSSIDNIFLKKAQKNLYWIDWKRYIKKEWLKAAAIICICRCSVILVVICLVISLFILTPSVAHWYSTGMRYFSMWVLNDSNTFPCIPLYSSAL